jgi:hypothetical protein
MKYLKIIIFFFLGVTCVYTLWHHHAISRLFVNQKLPEQLSGASEVSFMVGVSKPYDYERMLTIIEQAQKIKKAFADQFSEQLNADEARYLDLKFVRSVLSDLYRERVRLERRMHHIKVQPSEVPMYKKLRSLRYYQKTIEEYSQSLEEIVRQL